MDVSKLKHVVGQAETDKPAIIRFFGPVDRYSVEDFNAEFLWLQNCVKPSKIVVLINSEGGSVIYGMSTFSIIQSCPIDVDCVIEGIAASMGSVIWAAGKRLYMHDYSILMVHNPFSSGMDESDENTQAMIKAFRGQLETIYCKRFSMKKDDVKKMMDGEEGVDGTFMDAKAVVEAGIISKDHVIKTPKHIRDQIEAGIGGVEDPASLRDIMTPNQEEGGKLVKNVCAILEKNTQESINQNTMEKNENPMFAAVASQLGFSEDSALATVSNRINALVKAEAELKDVKAKFNELQVKYTGKETEVANLNEKLGEVEAKLKVYQDAEAAAVKAKIDEMVENAVKDGKIKAEAKSQWIAMAASNFETVKATLDSIQGRHKISDEIGKDNENLENAKNGLTPTEQELADKVAAVVGKDFKFKKLED